MGYLLSILSTASSKVIGVVIGLLDRLSEPFDRLPADKKRTVFCCSCFLN